MLLVRTYAVWFVRVDVESAMRESPRGRGSLRAMDVPLDSALQASRGEKAMVMR